MYVSACSCTCIYMSTRVRVFVHFVHLYICSLRSCTHPRLYACTEKITHVPIIVLFTAMHVKMLTVTHSVIGILTCRYICTLCKHTYTYTHALKQASTPPTHRHICAHKHSRNTRMHECMHACTRTHTSMHTNKQANTHTNTHTSIHTQHTDFFCTYYVCACAYLILCTMHENACTPSITTRAVSRFIEPLVCLGITFRMNSHLHNQNLPHWFLNSVCSRERSLQVCMKSRLRHLPIAD